MGTSRDGRSAGTKQADIVVDEIRKLGGTAVANYGFNYLNIKMQFVNNKTYIMLLFILVYSFSYYFLFTN